MVITGITFEAQASRVDVERDLTVNHDRDYTVEVCFTARGLTYQEQQAIHSRLQEMGTVTVRVEERA